MPKTRFRDEDLEEPTEEEAAPVSPLAAFFDLGLIEGEPALIRSGKEATVYRCDAGARAGVRFLAAKVYRSRENRSFKNDSVYQEGRVILDSRIARAVQNKSKMGREAHGMLWLEQEWETLNRLEHDGVDLPKPYSRAESALLMEYIGDEESPAPHLQDTRLSPREARPLFERLMGNIETLLQRNVVHGDLSSYNILYWEGRLRIIDLPQAVDPRFNRNAQALLERDVGNVCRYFSRCGVTADPLRIAAAMWARFKVPGL